VTSSNGNLSIFPNIAFNAQRIERSAWPIGLQHYADPRKFMSLCREFMSVCCGYMGTCYNKSWTYMQTTRFFH